MYGVSSLVCHFYKKQFRKTGIAALERKIQPLSFAFLRTFLALFVGKWQQYEVQIQFSKLT